MDENNTSNHGNYSQQKWSQVLPQNAYIKIKNAWQKLD